MKSHLRVEERFPDFYFLHVKAGRKICSIVIYHLNKTFWDMSSFIRNDQGWYPQAFDTIMHLFLLLHIPSGYVRNTSLNNCISSFPKRLNPAICEQDTQTVTALPFFPSSSFNHGEVDSKSWVTCGGQKLWCRPVNWNERAGGYKTAPLIS